MGEKESYWSPLDNAAKIFPAVRSEEHTTVMRLTAVLKEPVTISALLKALEKADKRFPYYRVRLRRGFFWYYLEQVDEKLPVRPDDGMPCRAFGADRENKLLIRGLVLKNRISIECSHILTDGHGLLNYLKAILIYYFIEKGVASTNMMDKFFFDKTSQEEFEDAYSRYFKENIPAVIKQPKAFHLPYSLKKKPRFSILYAILSIDEIKGKALEKNVTITEYLVAVYLLVLQEVFLSCKKTRRSIPNKIARIQVPIDLRSIYSSKTMRNFSLFVMPEIDFRLGMYSFDEILKIVYHKMKLETDEKLISKIISRNVGSEKKFLVRGIPIWLKSLVLFLKYYSEGANQFSGVVTNLGKVDLPESISDKVDYFAVTPPPPNKKLKINCGVIGYGDKLVLSFGNITQSMDFEQKFLHYLTKQGVNVEIKKNI